jgi:hypothetical protein
MRVTEYLVDINFHKNRINPTLSHIIRLTIEIESTQEKNVERERGSEMGPSPPLHHEHLQVLGELAGTVPGPEVPAAGAVVMLRGGRGAQGRCGGRRGRGPR